MPDTDIKVRRRIYRAQLGAYCLIVLVGCLGFWTINHTQDDLQRSQQCTQEFLAATVTALNERTQYSGAQADANIELQKSQLKFLNAISRPGSPDQAVNDYLDALQEFIKVTALQANTVEANPYPTSDDYRACLKGGD